MLSKSFKSFLPPFLEKPKAQSRQPSSAVSFEKLILLNFSVTSWLLMGALCQSLLVAFVPRLYAFAPTALILLVRLLNNIAITLGYKRNPYLHSAIMSRVTAQVPNIEGEFSDQSANEKVVVFLLGAKINHPLGIFSPNFKELGERMGSMWRLLDESKDNNGFLGNTSWTSHDERGATELLSLSYWRTIEDLHQFAYGPAHKDTWNWWNNLSKFGSQHIGINHEVYAVDKGQWENVYINFQPTLLGGTTYLRQGDKSIGGTVDDQWISPLIDASKGKLRSSAGRLGWQPEKLYEKYDHQPQEGY